jgi:hypothetical protein
MAELRSAIFWVLCPKQSLHCYINQEELRRKAPQLFLKFYSNCQPKPRKILKTLLRNVFKIFLGLGWSAKRCKT